MESTSRDEQTHGRLAEAGRETHERVSFARRIGQLELVSATLEEAIDYQRMCQPVSLGRHQRYFGVLRLKGSRSKVEVISRGDRVRLEGHRSADSSGLRSSGTVSSTSAAHSASRSPVGVRALIIWWISSPIYKPFADPHAVRDAAVPSRAVFTHQ
jgi:hypothetical protein